MGRDEGRAAAAGSRSSGVRATGAALGNDPWEGRLRGECPKWGKSPACQGTRALLRQSRGRHGVRLFLGVVALGSGSGFQAYFGSGRNVSPPPQLLPPGTAVPPAFGLGRSAHTDTSHPPGTFARHDTMSLSSGS